MKQNTIESFAKLAEILRAHIGQIKGDDGNLLSWETGVKYTIDIQLAELDKKYEGAISEWMDDMSDNDGVITDYALVHALNPCLADVNAVANEQYANFLRTIVKDGWKPSEDLYGWQIGYPLFYSQDSKTLRLTIVGKPKEMYTPDYYSTYGRRPENLLMDFYEVLRAHIGQIDVDGDKIKGYGHEVTYSLDISLAELDAKCGGVISDWLDDMDNDDDLIHALNPCLADINALNNEDYANYLRDLVEDGWSSCRYTLSDWEMGYPLLFDAHTKTLHLTVFGIEKDMYTHL